MKLVGLAGGIASGKSEVARLLEELGAGRIDADRLGHEVLLDPEVMSRIREEFGDQVFDDQGAVDRRRLGALVFATTPDSTTPLSRLESITHPAIGRLVRRELERLRRAGFPVVVLDASVMFRSGWDRWCDRIVFVDAALELRRERAAARGWPEGELDRREAFQTPVAEKRHRSTDVIDNNRQADVVWLKQQVLAFWRDLTEAARKTESG
jgi:dephospho-CoA kinase